MKTFTHKFKKKSIFYYKFFGIKISEILNKIVNLSQTL